MHLRCRFTKNSPRRTTSTPAGVFCALLASASSISKGLRKKDCSKPPRRAVVPRRSEFACGLVAQECTGRTFLGEDVRGSTQKRRFVLCTNLVVRTPKDGREISQKQLLEQTLSSTDVHGRTSVERYTDIHSLAYRQFCTRVFARSYFGSLSF